MSAQKLPDRIALILAALATTAHQIGRGGPGAEMPSEAELERALDQTRQCAGNAEGELRDLFLSALGFAALGCLDELADRGLIERGQFPDGLVGKIMTGSVNRVLNQVVAADLPIARERLQ